MRAKCFTIAIIVLLAGFVDSLFAQRTYLPFTPQSTKTAKIKNSTPLRLFEDSGNNGVEMEYSFSGAFLSENHIQDVAQYFLHLEGFNTGGEVGKPSLPFRNELIALPLGAKPKVVIEKQAFVEHSGYFIHPVLPPATDAKGAKEPEYQIDSAFYKTNSFYPQNIVEIVDVQISRGIPIAMVRISPVQYNPATNTLRTYYDLKVQVEFEGAESATDLSFKSAAYSSSVQGVVSNKAIFEDQEKNGQVVEAEKAGAVDYLLITHDEYLPAARELAVWKAQLGYKVDIISSDKWTSDMVKDSIAYRYEKQNTKPGYFAILGDHTGRYAVPGQEITSRGAYFATDHYYACFDGAGDYFPDMAHGRISVSSLSEAYAVIDKIISYEKTPPANPGFYSSSVHASYFQHDKDGYAKRRFAQTSEEILEYMSSEQGFTPSRIYYAEPSVDPTHWNNGYYSSGEAIPSELLKPHFAWDGDAADISSAINSGVLYVLHRDHGYEYGWGDPAYSVKHIDALSNGHKTPVVFSMNCLTGKFMEDECFSESFLRHPSGGAVGVFGHAEVSLSGYNDGLAIGLFDAIWASPGLTADFTGSGSSAVQVSGHKAQLSMGDAANQALLRMLETWGDSWGYAKYIHELFHYFGDPAMKMWTSEPSAINASYGESVDCGAMSLSITDIDCDGLATVLYNNKLVGSAIVAESNAFIEFSAPVSDQYGYIVLTISDTNRVPLVDTIFVNGNCEIPPISGFSANSSQLCLSESIRFADESYFSPESWTWRFTPNTIAYLNGTTENSQYPEVEFQEAGLYSVRLIAANAFGADTVEKHDCIEALGINAGFVSSGNKTRPGESVTIYDQTTCWATNWEWSINPNCATYINGSSESSQNIEVIFDSIGAYTIQLIASNDVSSDTIVVEDYIEMVSGYNMQEETYSGLASGKLYDDGGIGGAYSDGVECSFIIEPECADTIYFQIDSLDLFENDYLQIYSGQGKSAELLAVYTGTKLPNEKIMTTAGSMTVSFYSAQSGNTAKPDGFEASWTSVRKDWLPMPVADFSLSNTAPPFNTAVMFSDATLNGPHSWTWSLGDGAMESTQNVCHSYTEAGQKTIELFAENCSGTHTISKSLTVQEKPVLGISTDTVELYVHLMDSMTYYHPFTNQGMGDLVCEIEKGGVFHRENLPDASGIREYESENGVLEYSVANFAEHADVEYQDLSGIKIGLDETDCVADFIVDLESRGAMVVKVDYSDKDGVRDDIDAYVIGDEIANFSSEVVAAIRNRVSVGAGLYLMGDFSGSSVNINALVDGAGLYYGTYPGTHDSLFANIVGHSITKDVDAIESKCYGAYYVVSGTADCLVPDGENAHVAIAELGQGRIVAVGNELPCQHLYASGIRLFNNRALDFLVGGSKWISLIASADTTGAGECGSLGLNVDADGLGLGTYCSSICIRTNDPYKALCNIPVKLIVADNHAPIVLAPQQDTIVYASKTQKYVFDASTMFSDPENDILKYSLNFSNPEFDSERCLVNEDGVCSLTLSSSGGITKVTVLARDVHGSQNKSSFYLTVIENSKPVVTVKENSLMVYAKQEAIFNLDSMFADPDGEYLTFSYNTFASSILNTELNDGDITVVPLQAGVDSVEITAYDNWFESASICLYFKVVQEDIDIIPESFNVKIESKLYPNPVADIATVSFALAKTSDVEVQVYSSNGQRALHVSEGVIKQGCANITINASELTSGLYFYRLIVDGSVADTGSFVKK